MARISKPGLDYFPLDVNFLQDRKVRRISCRHHAAGIAALTSLLCLIYKEKGYYISWNKDTLFDIAQEACCEEEEMQAIIDAGGKIQDIIIEHPVYGRISAPLEIYSRNDIVKFKEKMQSGNAVPLCDITSGVHYHTILAYSDEILDDVAAALKSNGFLLSR